jgi:hypothetical protein
MKAVRERSTKKPAGRLYLRPAFFEEMSAVRIKISAKFPGQNFPENRMSSSMSVFLKMLSIQLKFETSPIGDIKSRSSNRWLT